MNEATEFRRLLVAKLRPYCSLSAEQADFLYRHYSLMCKWNRNMSLTAVTVLEEAVERHYCESLFAALHISRDVRSVGDIGSGAGFPGVPIACYRQELQVFLVESQQRKAAFLRETSDGLPNVVVRAVRGDSWLDRVDLLVSRAVRSSDVLSLVPSRAPTFLLMVGESDLKSIRDRQGFDLDAPIRIPWGERRYLLRGQVPRETEETGGAHQVGGRRQAGST
jgi:16S rRNA (guanine527-N7)-methyltransferase